ncbi:amidohydrolase family protein [Parasphingopyxis marina]|uniref:Amidohydrolase n=1 Tax=Parasphingopyxis marina TaxID=2761622 RepID=A0A842I1P2_9SPHN|nr:amidohydrolase family protein [Parasphingopyxis marina]MBC2778599.1 amidohydrolase [Parasphingopyxis marina]
MTQDYKRIGTEEAFMTPLVVDLFKKGVEDGSISDPGFVGMYKLLFAPDTVKLPLLLDLEEGRIPEMDAAGIDMHVLAQTAPGLQIFDKDTAVGAMPDVNDYLVDVIARHPTRFAGLASIAPQDPEASAREIERARTKLDLGGVMINSHTHDEWLSDEKFWPILEAAEANDMPIYIHPQTPMTGLKAFTDYGIDLAFYGFAVEVSTHMLTIILSGALDRFPKLKFVLGHLGEGLPYWLYRFDYMQYSTDRPNLKMRPNPVKRELPNISDYIRRNIWITTSGMPAPEPIKFATKQMGEDHILYAMDYPYEMDREEVPMTEEGVPDAQKKKFWEDNARGLFHIDGPVGA